jgi:hypothetical protein
MTIDINTSTIIFTSLVLSLMYIISKTQNKFSNMDFRYVINPYILQNQNKLSLFCTIPSLIISMFVGLITCFIGLIVINSISQAMPRTTNLSTSMS